MLFVSVVWLWLGRILERSTWKLPWGLYGYCARSERRSWPNQWYVYLLCVKAATAFSAS